MTKRYLVSRSFFIALLISFVWPTVGLGQLTLVSSTPVDGGTGVGRPTTFELVFSAALDTNARFEEPSDFFLNIEIFPGDSVGEPQDISVSPDLRTVTVSGFELTADTRFTTFLTGAKSMGGDMLVHPYVMTFTTGASLPGGSVSGEISLDGNPANGAVVALFEELFEDDPILLGVASPTYTVSFVPDGTYFPLSVMDTNGDGLVNPSDGDALGFYDPNFDGEPDPILVSNANAVTNIDLTISEPVATTARAMLGDMMTAAQTWASDALLVSLGSDGLSTNGESFGWSFRFYSPAMETYQEFFTIGTAVLGESQEDHGFGTLPLPENWVDSDIVLPLADNNGGNAFRTEFSDAEVYASLEYFRLYYESETAASRNIDRSLVKGARLQASRGVPTGELQVFEETDQLATWRVHYNSEEAEEYFQVEINAETGNLLASDVLSNVDAALQWAQEWAADAELVRIQNERDLTVDGMSVAWGFLYRSASLDSLLEFVAVSGKVLGKKTNNYGNWPFGALPAQFCNSTEVMAVAQEESQAFRAQYPDAYIIAELTMGQHENPNTPTWRISYHTFDDNHFEVLIDAQTCALPTSVDGSSAIPLDFSLDQNYPNPFNPSTEISYQLAQAVEVELSVFNVLGQRIRLLVGDEQAAGPYRVQWDGNDAEGNRAPSGVYVYRLQAGDFTQSKKMLLIR